ncbi:MAG: polysaccharide deacetylase family protein [Elusimicrobia bacterium]|nr:polysaccharide deacetylase family protein [Elusimicrobiota bacterium]
MSLKHLAYRGLSRLWALRPAARPKAGLRALLYHSIGSTVPNDHYGLSLSPRRFEEHLEALAEARADWEWALFAKPRPDRLQVAITFDDGYKDTLRVAAPLLAKRGIPFTVFVASSYVLSKNSLYLTAKELKELSQFKNVLIGAHGHHHKALSSLGADALSNELVKSREILEDLLGKPVTTLSYPHGAVNRRVRDAASAAGYALGGCSRYGLNAPDRDPLLLCRTELTAWDTARDFSLKLEGSWDWFAWRRRDPAR